MAAMNQTSLYFSIAPRSESGETTNAGGHTYNIYGEGSDTVLRSVNSPIILQMYWNNSTTNLSQYDEGTGGSGERIEGDLVNVLFDIYEADNYMATPSIANDFRLICTIKKPKDSPMKWSGRPLDEEPLEGHRFTINIAEILADLLSYSLVPVGIGTWGCIDTGNAGPQAETGSRSTTVSKFGGMNGQWVESNVARTSVDQNQYNLSSNGCDRRIRVVARFEILAADGSLEICTSPATRSFSDFFICNAAPQWGDRHDLKDREVGLFNGALPAIPQFFLTNSPNWSNGDTNQAFKKIRLDDEAEYLQWFLGVLPVTATYDIEGVGIRVDSCAEPTFSSGLTTAYLTDCTSDSRMYVDGGDVSVTQNRLVVQNVSPTYINNHNNGLVREHNTWGHVAGTISISKPYYRCSVYVYDDDGAQFRCTVYQYYELDTESKGSWSDVCGMKEGVKFMWLNRMGGIDSYVAKRIFSKSVNIQRETITKKSPDRLHSQNTGITGIPWNNNIGANMYPHSREVLNVDANRAFSAMTDPLTTVEANWLEELLTSPNVWVIQENDGSQYLEGRTPTEESRPSTSGYMPVLITNSDVVLIDEEQGLVQINIEFIESHKINTQRN